MKGFDGVGAVTVGDMYTYVKLATLFFQQCIYVVTRKDMALKSDSQRKTCLCCKVIPFPKESAIRTIN